MFLRIYVKCGFVWCVWTYVQMHYPIFVVLLSTIKSGTLCKNNIASVSYHFVQDCNAAGILDLRKIHTDYSIADINTKLLEGSTFHRHPKVFWRTCCCVNLTQLLILFFNSLISFWVWQKFWLSYFFPKMLIPYQSAQEWTDPLCLIHQPSINKLWWWFALIFHVQQAKITLKNWFVIASKIVLYFIASFGSAFFLKIVFVFIIFWQSSYNLIWVLSSAILLYKIHYLFCNW